ncbi:MAG: type III secretion HpaP family protein [Puniceicoccales bacterium]|jgi:hypothetical protein|nr:type III secretion HpaP family protein [Puniceicoccales bacterium]
MTDKIKHQSMEKESKDSFENDAFSKKEIAEIKDKADPRDASLFAEKLAISKSDQQGSVSDGSKTDLMKHRFDDDARDFLNSQETKDFIKADQKDFTMPQETTIPQETAHVPVDIPLVNEHANLQRQDFVPKSVDAAEVKDTSAISGARILDNMQLQHIEPKVNESAQVIKNLALQVAEKIIATNEALNAKQEVRITLQNGILKDTEVSIFKDGKALGVIFSTGSNESENLLRANSDALMRQLQNNLKDIDRVDIEIEQHDQQNANDDQGNKGRGNQQQEEEEEKQDQ